MAGREVSLLSGSRLGLIVVAAVLTFTAAVYAHLPAELPALLTSERGAASIARWPGAFAGPALAAAIWAALRLLTHFDPAPDENQRIRANLWRIANLLILLTVLVHTFTLGAALGWPVDGSGFLLGAVGLLFLSLSEYLPQARVRALVAIRTPWTLRSDEVWASTHRLAGRTLRIGSAVILAGVIAPVEWRPALGVLGVTIGGFAPVLYSYLIRARS